MTGFLALLFLLSFPGAIAVCMEKTVPYLKKNGYDAEPDLYMMLHRVFWYLYVALLIGYERKNTPKDVWIHGLLLVVSVVSFVMFLVMDYRAG